MRKLFRVALCAAAVHGIAIARPAIARAQDVSLPPLPAPAGEAPATVPSGEPAAEANFPPSGAPVVVSSRRANPEPAPAPAEPASAEPTEPATRWYGYQTLAVDLLSGVVIAATLAANNGAGFAVGVTMYAVGGPIVQAVHHRGYVPWLDLGIRLTAPLIGTFLGVLVAGVAGVPACDNSGGFAGLCSIAWGAAIGFGVGAGAAVALDAAVFSREKVPEPAAASRTSPGAFDVSFAPVITMNRDDRRNLRPIVGIGGTF
jgi:hypothetical protein